MNCKKLLPFLAFAFILFSCHNRSESSQADETLLNKIAIEPQQSSKEPQQPIPAGKITQGTDSTGTQKISQQQNIDWDKKIIKTATLTFEVKDFTVFTANVYKTVKQFGGYIAQESQTDQPAL